MKGKTPKPPMFIWADYDGKYPRNSRWSFYATKADQRSNRPDLKPIKLTIGTSDGGAR
jgi:hypothetical protein